MSEVTSRSVVRRKRAMKGRDTLDTAGYPRLMNGRVSCDCECHGICHTCGNPFVEGQMHVNCADMIQPQHPGWTKKYGSGYDC